jgi:hypothetical protein
MIIFRKYTDNIIAKLSATMNDPAASGWGIRQGFCGVASAGKGARLKSLVGNAHRRYELDMLFVFKIPREKGLAVLLLK